MERFLNLPALASEHGARTDHLIGLVHVLMLVLFVVWTCVFIYILFRFRAGRNPQADYKGLRAGLTKYPEIAIVAAELVLLFAFSIPLYSERVADLPSEDDAVRVRVQGQQFAWNIHYPGPDGIYGRTDIELVDEATNPLGLDRDDEAAKDDVTTINQLHLPVDRPALVELSAKDVIHSFYLPEMRVKQDAIPGLRFPVWFVPTVTTEQMRADKGDPEFQYEIGCAQLCGLGHYRMRGFMTIHTQESYDAWMEEQQSYNEADSGTDDFWG